MLVFDPSYQPPSLRPLPTLDQAPPASVAKPAVPPMFTKRQVLGRQRQLKALYRERLLTDEFYLRKAAELEAVP